MDQTSNNISSSPASVDKTVSATPLTPLELNAIRLDTTHTVLTPDYLEKIKANSGDEKPR